jgi:hypothetical protein
LRWGGNEGKEEEEEKTLDKEALCERLKMHVDVVMVIVNEFK